MNDDRCPRCGAALQENAHFCLHCMTSLDDKTQLRFRRRRRLPLLLASGALLLLAAVTLVFLLPKKTAPAEETHKPICTFLQFQRAVHFLSRELGVDELWEPDGFVQTAEDGGWTAYATELHIEQTQAEIRFYRDGEQIAIIFYDIPQRVNEAYWLAVCELLSVTRRNETLRDVLYDRASYPAEVLDAPFPPEVTGLYGRTRQYDAALENGTQITTFYQRYDEACESVYADFYEIKRVTDGTVQYDLVIWLANDS